MPLFPKQPRTTAERRAAIVPTLEYLGLSPGAVRLLGGSGLALLNIDTRAGVDNSEAALAFFGQYDIDGLLPDEDFIALKRAYPNRKERHLTYVHTVPARKGRPAFQGLHAGEGWRVFGLHTLPEEQTRPVSIDGYATFPAATLALLKNKRSSDKDAVQLIIGHVHAFESDNSIASEPAWQAQIDIAVREIEQSESVRGAITQAHAALPPSFIALADNHFKHPAFA